jgi:hypothetical protein
MDPEPEIRDFLAFRRARLAPEPAGLPVFGSNRRVKGLRREEVAMLAGISAEYYVRIERGRNAHRLPEPSTPRPPGGPRRTTRREIEASLCQGACWGALKQRRGRGRSVGFGSGSDLFRSAGVQGSAGHAGLKSRP